ncbi:MAG TPA: bifunctional oligoribonuclease/PAP phosphatase NrnA [Candidatus Binataceae bacterium]|nr:bifunctional oligoribonuclease/PAP phosphatase NrnA [Candidatus Binataceae bacterium]
MDQAYTKQKLKELRALVDEGDRVAIMLQDDPDPDAMASAMALRTLLGRNKLTTPLFSFKPVTRPENRTMVHLLEIDIEPAQTAELDEYDKIAMVDVQPPFFGERLTRAHIIIDHHPNYEPTDAPFVDVRTKYGATSTIMTEYLISADERISERLATALLYGIRSDTLALSRRVTDDDLQAFVTLYPIANYNMLKQIERPELPAEFARILSRALARMEVVDGLVVLNLGQVERDDIIVQVADFCLQFEGVEWVAVAGKLGSDLVIAVRNYGMSGDNAGEAVKSLFGNIGSAGGHRNMAKAVIKQTAWRRREGSTRDRVVEERLRQLFLGEISGERGSHESRLASRNGG